MEVMTLKTCARCGESKPLDGFHRSRQHKDGRCYTCKACRCREMRAVRTERLRSNERRAYLRRKYDLGLDEYEAMVLAQSGTCAICGGPPRGNGGKLVIDHCHATGAVRGLLCDFCNKAIGMLGDDPEIVKKALLYLERS